MSDAPPIRSLRDLARALPRPRPLAGQEVVLRHCALLRSFNEPLFDRVLKPDLPRGSTLSFGALSRLPEVAAVPRVRAEFYVKDEPRARLLESWQTDSKRLRTFSRRMLQYYGASSTLERLTHLLFADPPRALRGFRAQYQRADREGDLATCDSLLRILRNRSTLLSHVSPSLFEFLQNQEQYLRSRVLFVDDWTRSTHYLERRDVTRRVESFLRHKTQWLLQIHAKGGLGKTAFLQWLIARRLVVARTGPRSWRYAVARIDFDRVNRAAVAAVPGLLLIRAADQLDRQLAHGTSSSLFTGVLADNRRFAPALLPAPIRGPDHGADLSISDTEKQEIEDGFCRQLGDRRALLILDTVEEMILHRPDEWLDTLKLLQRVQDQCRGLKVIVSGRYDFRKRRAFAGWARGAKRAMSTLALRPFTSHESLEYLQRIRRLRPLFRRRSVPLPAQGNPFKLALFADIVGAGGTFTLKDLSELRRADVQYLIRRIIERLSDCELQWTLRYAVVPHQLTKEFLAEVVLPHLCREAARPSRDHPHEYLPAGGEIVKTSPSWPPCNSSFDVERVWSNLLKYAGAASWMTSEQGVPTLQPELKIPMLYLLQSQPVYADLHRDAARYFERMQAAAPSHRGEYAAEALYHWFQAEGAAASSHWHRLLESPMAREPKFREQLANSLLGNDYLDDDEEPVPHQSGGQIMGLDTLAEAHFELASAAVRRALEAGNGRAPGPSAERHLQRVRAIEARLKRSVIDIGRLALVEASLLSLVQSAGGQTAKAAESVDRALATGSADPRYEVSLLVAKGNALATVNPVAADECYARAAELAQADAAPFVSYHWIRARQGRLHFDRGDLALAEAHYDQAIRALVGAHADPADIVDRVRDLIEVLYHAARWSEVHRWIRFAHENLEGSGLVGRFVTEQTARLAVAERRMMDVSPTWSSDPAEARWQAAQLAALHHPAALAGFDAATRLYESAGNTAEGQSCQIDKLLYLVRVLGNLTVAKTVASKLDPSGPNWLRGQLVLCELWRRLSPRRARDLWRRVWRDARKRGSPREQAAALATALASRLEAPSRAHRLSELLQTIRPAPARLPLLAPFEYFVRAARGSRAPAGVFRDMMPDLAPGEPDFALRAVLVADAWRFAGDARTAEALLRGALEDPAAQEPLLRRKLLLALERLDVPVDDQLISDYLSDVRVRCAGFKSFVTAAHVEQAERWLRHGHAESAARTIEWTNVVDSEPDQYVCRYLALRARLSAHEDDSARYAREARSMASLLGLTRTFVDVRQAEPPMMQVQAGPFRLSVHVVHVKRSGERHLDLFIYAVGKSVSHQRVALAQNSVLFAVLATRGSTKALESLLGTATSARAELRRALPVAAKMGRGPAAADAGLLLQFDDDALAALPWEWAFADAPYAYVARGTGTDPLADTVRWVQSGLSRLGHPLVADGNAGPQTLSALRTVDRAEKILVRGAMDAVAKGRLRKLLPRGPVAVVCRNYQIERSSRLGYGAFGLDIGHLWRRQVKEAILLDPTDATSLESGLRSSQPEVIHITLSVASSGTELRLAADRSGDVARPGNTPAADLTPAGVSRLLQATRRGDTRPFLILDIPHRGSRAEAVRLLYFRNQFAQQLLALGQVRGILATGLAGGKTRALASLIIRHVASLHDVVTLARAASKLTSEAPSAIFANDPTLPIW